MVSLALDPPPSLREEVRRRGGRLFILGVGGSAANASHAVNDFRKIAGIEAYAPTDNVAELTAILRALEAVGRLRGFHGNAAHLIAKFLIQSGRRGFFQ